MENGDEIDVVIEQTGGNCWLFMYFLYYKLYVWIKCKIKK